MGIVQLWKGKGTLAKAYWGYYFLPAIILYGLLASLPDIEKISTIYAKWVAIICIVMGCVIYFQGPVLIWKNRRNAISDMWKYLAAFIIITTPFRWIINYPDIKFNIFIKISLYVCCVNIIFTIFKSFYNENKIIKWMSDTIISYSIGISQLFMFIGITVIGHN